MTANELVAERGKTYGHPRDDFRRTVGMLNELLGEEYLKKPLPVDIWPKIMILAKISRSMHVYHPDNMADVQGYAVTHEMLFDDDSTYAPV